MTYKDLEIILQECNETMRETTDLALARRYKKYAADIAAEIKRRKAKNAKSAGAKRRLGIAA